ncbi:MAG TPA: glycosyltransferase [Candidatus Obscuribacterales bacterium]
MSKFISVVIPTYNRPDLLARCLECLTPDVQGLAADAYEVIVTDDGPGDVTRTMIGSRFPWAKWIAGPRRGPAANRNNGAKAASGEWLAFVDDDCLPQPGWLASIQEAAREEGVEVIEGKTVIPEKVDNPFLQGVENLTGGVFWSCNLAVRRETFLKLGGFDEDFLEAGGEDMEFAWRIQQRNLKAKFCPEALVFHPVRPASLKTLIWRVRLSRWILLYYHKTSQAVPLSESSFKAAWSVAARLLSDFPRQVGHFYLKHLPSTWRTGWRTSLFNHVWGILTFPLLVPYMMMWELRFRRQLLERQKEGQKEAAVASKNRAGRAE